MSSELPVASAAPLPVSFDDVAGFTRKLVHDVRNGLNALDLHLASMLDLAEGPDHPLAEDVKLARTLLHNEARRLVELAARFRQPSPQIIDYLAEDLIEDMRGRIDRALGAGAPSITWMLAVKSERVAVDFEILSDVVVELVRNAMHFREGEAPLEARAAIEDGLFLLELKQTRSTVSGDPSHWGTVPFSSTRRGAYGLGLFAARRALAALGGTLSIGHSAERRELISRLSLPLAS